MSLQRPSVRNERRDAPDCVGARLRDAPPRAERSRPANDVVPPLDRRLRPFAGAALVLVALLAQAIDARSEPVSTASASALLERARATAARARDKSTQVSMMISGTHGSTLSRSLRGYEKQTAEGRKILWVFDAPQDLAGTCFLAWRRPEGRELLYVYFPAQRRVRQVTDQMRRERFQSSDLTYDDLAAILYFDYDGTHSLLREEPCGSTICTVIETDLTPGRFAYGKLRTWLRADLLLPTRIEFDYDDTVKEVQILEVATIEGIPTVLKLEARHVRDGSRTTVDFSKVHYNTGLADEMFSLGSLSHGG